MYREAFFEGSRAYGKAKKIDDIMIRVQDRLFYVDEKISDVSNFFNALCSERWDNGNELSIGIEDPDIFEVCLDFVYAKNFIRLTPENVFDVYVAADFFLLPELVNKCSECIVDNIICNNHSVEDVLEFANYFNDNNLQTKCMKVLARIHMKMPEKLPLNFHPQYMKTIIEEWGALKVDSRILFHCVIAWVKEEPEGQVIRKNFLPTLLKCVKLEDFSLEFLDNNVLKNQVIKDSNESLSQVREVRKAIVFAHITNLYESSGEWEMW